MSVFVVVALRARCVFHLLFCWCAASISDEFSFLIALVCVAIGRFIVATLSFNNQIWAGVVQVEYPPPVQF